MHMAAERIAEMTLDELKRLIAKEVDRRMLIVQKPDDRRTVQEILDSIDRHLWTPPPGTPSTLQLLREDRDA
jgi:hypothetical protein